MSELWPFRTIFGEGVILTKALGKLNSSLRFLETMPPEVSIFHFWQNGILSNLSGMAFHFLDFSFDLGRF